jgi:hypothetical protein
MLDDPIDELGLGRIASYLRTLYPQYSECELVHMLSAIARHVGCTCSLCSPSKFPGCQQEG